MARKLPPLVRGRAVFVHASQEAKRACASRSVNQMSGFFIVRQKMPAIQSPQERLGDHELAVIPILVAQYDFFTTAMKSGDLDGEIRRPPDHLRDRRRSEFPLGALKQP